jgi:hypothetical protein
MGKTSYSALELSIPFFIYGFVNKITNTLLIFQNKFAKESDMKIMDFLTYNSVYISEKL